MLLRAFGVMLIVAGAIIGMKLIEEDLWSEGEVNYGNDTLLNDQGRRAKVFTFIL